MFGASSELTPNMFGVGASSELASVMEFGFYIEKAVFVPWRFQSRFQSRFSAQWNTPFRGYSIIGSGSGFTVNHFRFGFIVHPDPDPIIAVRCLSVETETITYMQVTLISGGCAVCSRRRDL